jgi:putative transposase
MPPKYPCKRIDLLFGITITIRAVERFWRTIKYEYIYLHEFKDGKALFDGLLKFIQFYNFERKHQSLLYLTPHQVFNERLLITKNSTKLNKM